MIEASNISKTYHNRKILDSICVTVEPNSMTILTGESGKGKTTLINILSLIETQDEGTLTFNGISNPTARQVMLFRRHSIAYLFQNYGLIDEYTVEKNLQLSFAYKKPKIRKDAMYYALAQVGLEGFEKRRVYELSGGEQQRIALARVLLKDASYIFADEPTGNLDPKNRDIVMNILRNQVASGKGVVLATHDAKILSGADNCINL